MSLAANAMATDYWGPSPYGYHSSPPSPNPPSPPPSSPPPPAPKPSSSPPPPYWNPAPQTPKPSPPHASPPTPAPKPSPPTYFTPEKPEAKPKHEKPKHEKPKGDNKKHFHVKMGVEGLIMCKNDSKTTPIEGAVARITCLAINVHGFQVAPFSCRSHPTDKKGYFFATFSREELINVLKIIECKAFLEYSPVNTCKVPTDINNGISGCPLNSFKVLSHNHVKLYSAKALYFAPAPLGSSPANLVGY